MQPSDLHTFQARLSAEHDSLSGRLKQVSEFITNNPHAVALDTAAVIATKSGVYASALVRFANHFEFNGFSDLQKLYKDDLHLQYNDYSERIRTVQQSPDANGEVAPAQLLHEFANANLASLQSLEQQVDAKQLDNAVDAMESAQSIFVCGVRRALPVAMSLSYALNHMKKSCQTIHGLGMIHEEEAACISDDDTLIAITYKPYADFTQSVINTAHKNGAKIILITSDDDCPSADIASITFKVEDAQVRSFRSLTNSMCLAQTLCIALGYRMNKTSNEED